jgi:drug/metabolite transporter (DMT)-like permease
MLFSGAANTIVYKYQNNQITSLGPYDHAFFQTQNMFIGEFLCFIIYMTFNFSTNAMKFEQREARKGGVKWDTSPLWFAVPGTIDALNSSLQFFALTLVDSSIYQMIRGGVIIVVAIFSKLFLRREIFPHKWLGVFLSFLGITVVGVNYVLDSNSTTDNSNALIGTILLFVSLLANGTYFVFEELVFSKYQLAPMHAVGLEGLFGICTMTLIIFATFFVPCYTDVLCHQGNLERADLALREVFSDMTLLTFVVGGMLTIALFNYSGVFVTKNVSSLARSILDASRTLLVWVFDLVFSGFPFSWIQMGTL